MKDRILPLDEVVNFRDFGGYSGAGGARIAKGRLYRSAHLGRASDRDLEAIGALGVAVVVDLRRQNERAREPSRRPADFDGVVVESNLGPPDDDPWWSFIRNSDLTVGEMRAFLTDYYRRAPYDQRHLDLFSRYFQALAETEGAVLIHCAAGKDRTGLLAALTHHLLGVHSDDIVEDYLLTNTAIPMESRAPLMAQAIEETVGRAPSPEAVRAAMGVEADYLHAAFAEIARTHGGVDAYLETALGVDASVRARIAGRLLRAAEGA